MIRIIKMDGQVSDGRMFAIWDTVTARFLEILGRWAWGSLDELKQDLDGQVEISHRHSWERHDAAVARRDRLLSLARSAGY